MKLAVTYCPIRLESIAMPHTWNIPAEQPRNRIANTSAPNTSALSFSAWLVLWILILVVVGCASPPVQEKQMPVSGRAEVLQALKSASDHGAGINRSGMVATALSSSDLNLAHPLKTLDPEGSHGSRSFCLTLKDGTRVGGLFFEYDDGSSDPKPLLIASFGFLQDRWGTEAAKFYDLYLKSPATRLPAHVLILDHPSAGTFLAANGLLSIGSYDDARMWIEVAQHLSRGMKLSGIHLFGVSMSGQTVVHALVEDDRLGLDLFASGMAISIAPDFQKAPGKQLAIMDTAAGVDNPWRPYFKGTPRRTFSDEIQCTALWLLIKNQFVPHFQFVDPTSSNLNLMRRDVPVFLRNAFEERIARLRDCGDASWNGADFSLAGLEKYMASTRIAGVLQQVRTPLLLVSAFDDPLVERSMFVELLAVAQENSWIMAYETLDGGHFGFDVAYGPDYIGRLTRLMMNPHVLASWSRSELQ